MKQLAIVLLFTLMLIACNSNEEKTVIKNLTVPNEMITLMLQKKLEGKYDNVWDAAEGLAAVKKDDKWGFVDTSGTVVIPIQFDDPATFKQGYTQVRKEGKAGVIDKKGTVLVPFQYDYIGSYNDGVFSARDFNNKYGFIDSAGKIIIPFEYDEVNISWFSGGLAIVKKKEKWGAIDKGNKAIIPFVYDELSINDGFENGFVVAKKGTTLILVDKSGKEIDLPNLANYESVTPTNENRLIVKDKRTSKIGMVDITGKVIIPLSYRYVTNFYKGFAIVDADSGRYLLDVTGKSYFEKTPWLNLETLTENLFYGNTNANETMYLFDLTGKHVVEQGFDNIIPMTDDLLLVNKDGKSWYINYKGEKVADLPNY
jgi:hypothetical protein